MTEKTKIRTTRQINRAIDELFTSSNRIRISGLTKQNSIAVGIRGDREIRLAGDLGNYLGAFNHGCLITLDGNAGKYVGYSMEEGGIIINGTCGIGTGTFLKGGIIVVRSSTGDGLGQYQKDGTILVQGNVEGSVGQYSKGGTIIIVGKTMGRICSGATGGTVFLSSSFERMEPTFKESKMNGNDLNTLKRYFDHYGIKAEPRAFRKYAIS